VTATAPVPVYVASPLGFSMPTRIFYNRTLLPALSANGLEVLDPWAAPFADLDDALRLPPGPARDRALAAADRRLADRNRSLLDRCRAVFAVLDGSDVDSGTASEIGYAAALGRPVTGWRSDVRRTGDNEGTVVNLQVQYFIERGGGGVFSDLGAAIESLRRSVGLPVGSVQSRPGSIAP
jgi:nucleoside 2-deoxyribosyltransferase